MKKFFLLISALLGLGSMFLTGCETVPEESQLPHATPAYWEGTTPGMPTVPGQPRF